MVLFTGPSSHMLRFRSQKPCISTTARTHARPSTTSVAATRREAALSLASVLGCISFDSAAQAAYVDEAVAERVFVDVSAGVVSIEDFKAEAGEVLV